MSSLKFAYNQEQLQLTANLILERALKAGATSAQVEINEGIETGVTVLNESIEHFESSYSSALVLNLYVGHHRGSVAQSRIEPNNIDNIDNLVCHALSLAKYTQSDPQNGIADSAWLCNTLVNDLALYNPIAIANQKLVDRTKHVEQLGLTANNIKNSDGATISIGNYNFVLANSHGFNRGYQTTRYGISLSLIGENAHGMQTDYWADSSRNYHDLLTDTELTNTAVARTVRRLNAGTIVSGQYPVIFESPIAKSLIANYLAAVSGNNLFRRLSFLNDSLGTQVFPSWMHIYEDPFLVSGNSSCYFDNEGVAVSKRNLVTDGCVAGYLLNCYTARKLNTQSTGNSGGAHNVIVTPNYHGTLTDLVRTLNRGLVIIETIGHGVNLVTGDYSVGASGLWVEHGEIQFFVDNLTIAGNLRDIYNSICYVSDDVNAHSSIRCGSILVDQMQITVGENGSNC